MEPKLIGRYIVTDPNICHGQPTFRGTRIFVSDVLEQVASGMAWETIIDEYIFRKTQTSGRKRGEENVSG